MDEISRRSFLKSSSLLIVPPAVFLWPSASYAWVTAAITVATTLVSLFDKSGSGVLDRTDRVYLDQIISNQENLTQQLTEISDQLTTLATVTNLIPPQTLVLAAEVSAGSVYHAAARLEQGFVNDSLELANPSFGPVDRQRYNDHLEDIRRSASEHESLARQVGQSAEFAGSLELLRLAMKSMIVSAKTAGFTSSGDKRQLRDYVASIGAAATSILDGHGAPRLGLFVDHRSNNRAIIDSTVAGLISNREESEVRYITRNRVPDDFFTNMSQTRAERITVVDERFKPRGPDYSQLEELYPNLNASITGDGDILLSAGMEKKKFPGRLATDQHFSISLTPSNKVSNFAKLIETHNESKAIDYINVAAEYGLRSIVTRTRETIDEIATI